MICNTESGQISRLVLGCTEADFFQGAQNSRAGWHVPRAKCEADLEELELVQFAEVFDALRDRDA